MKPIKLRAWHPINHEMVYEKKGTNFGYGGYTRSDILRDFEDENIMQYTGKKDDNEKEIYDGDLVTDLNGETHSVEWNDDTLKWQLSNGRPLNDEENYSSYLIVIGNIFENKELILER